MKGRRVLGVLALAVLAALGVAAPWAMSSGKRAEATTTITSTVTTTTTVASTTVTVNNGASSSASSSSSSGGTGSSTSTGNGQQQQQQQNGGGGGVTVITITQPVVTVTQPATTVTVTVPIFVTTTTNTFTPPPSALTVTQGGSTVRRTANGWSVVVGFSANRSVVARACVMRNGVCVQRYGPVGVPAGDAAIALAVPASVGAGNRTVRVIFTSGTAARVLFYPVFLP